MSARECRNNNPLTWLSIPRVRRTPWQYRPWQLSVAQSAPCSQHHAQQTCNAQFWLSVGHAFHGHTLRVCRQQLHPTALEYSLRGDCLVALNENEKSNPYIGLHTSAITVFDLAAGGRMLCRLGDFMCALQPLPPAQLAGASHQVTLTLRRAGSRTRSRLSHCWTVGLGMRW